MLTISQLPRRLLPLPALVVVCVPHGLCLYCAYADNVPGATAIQQEQQQEEPEEEPEED